MREALFTMPVRPMNLADRVQDNEKTAPGVVPGAALVVLPNRDAGAYASTVAGSSAAAGEISGVVAPITGGGGGASASSPSGPNSTSLYR